MPGIIDEYYFDDLKHTLLNTNGFISIQRFREALNAFGCNFIRKRIEQDRTLIDHINNLRNESIRTNIETEKKIIKIKIVKGLLHLKSERDFFNFLSDNFINCDFEIAFNSPMVISRLTNKIDLLTRNDYSNNRRNLGITAIRRIVSNLKEIPDLYDDAFMYEPLLLNLKMLSEELYKTLLEEYKIFYKERNSN